MDIGFVFAQSITQALGVTAIIYCLAAIGLNIQFGYTGRNKALLFQLLFLAELTPISL